METTPLEFINADTPLSFVCGDTLLCRVNYNTDMTGASFEAGIKDYQGNTVTALTCSIPSGYTSTDGVIDIGLTSTQTEVLQITGRKNPSWTWFMARTVAGYERTELGGALNLKFR